MGGVACTLLLASPRACSSLTGRRFTVLWATYGFSRNPCHSSYGPHASPRLGTNTVVLSLCVPASQARTLGQAGLSPSGTELSQQSGYLRVLWAVPCSAARKGEHAKMPVCIFTSSRQRVFILRDGP